MIQSRKVIRPFPVRGCWLWPSPPWVRSRPRSSPQAAHAPLRGRPAASHGSRARRLPSRPCGVPPGKGLSRHILGGKPPPVFHGPLAFVRLRPCWDLRPGVRPPASCGVRARPEPAPLVVESPILAGSDFWVMGRAVSEHPFCCEKVDDLAM